MPVAANSKKPGTAPDSPQCIQSCTANSSSEPPQPLWSRTDGAHHIPTSPLLALLPQHTDQADQAVGCNTSAEHHVTSVQQPITSPFSALAAAPATPSSVVSSPLSRQGSVWSFWHPATSHMRSTSKPCLPLPATPQLVCRSGPVQSVGCTLPSDGADGQMAASGSTPCLLPRSGSIRSRASAWAGAESVRGLPDSPPQGLGGMVWRAPSLMQSHSGGSCFDEMALEDLQTTVRQLSMSCSMNSVALDSESSMSA